MVYTYLLLSKRARSFYTGISKDPVARLEKHNSGSVKSTASKRPLELVFVKPHQEYSEARKHELWLKKKSIEYKFKLSQIAQIAPPILDGVK